MKIWKKLLQVDKVYLEFIGNASRYIHTHYAFAIAFIQLFPEGEVNSGGYIPRREASRYISTALHRP